MSIAPTDNKYDLYVGMKGKLGNSVVFNVRASNKIKLIEHYLGNGFDGTGTNTNGYAYGNSFRNSI